MKKFFNSYRIIGLVYLIAIIINGILRQYEILTSKEYFVIFITISLLMIIGNLIIYIVDISKIISILKENNKTLNNGIGNCLLINNFLTNMCLIGYNYIDNIAWKKEWSDFVRNIEKIKNNQQDIKTPSDIDIIKDLKNNLKCFEEQEKFEECGKILEKIKQLENNK